jgi:hypothetical protein
MQVSKDVPVKIEKDRRTRNLGDGVGVAHELVQLLKPGQSHRQPFHEVVADVEEFKVGEVSEPRRHFVQAVLAQVYRPKTREEKKIVGEFGEAVAGQVDTQERGGQ